MSFATAYRQLFADARVGARPLPEERAAVGAPVPALLVRLRARARADRLERRLFDGERVAGDAVLAARAWQLTRPRACVRLAVALDAVLGEAAGEEPCGRDGAAVPVRRAAVAVARDELVRAGARLRAPRPVQPRGVAMLRRLLRDGNGPLYAPGPEGDEELWQWLRRAAIALD